MSGTLLMARRYLTHHRWRSAILAVGIGLTLFLPLAVQLLVARYGESLVQRAERTPLVLGAPGSRFDLVLDSLYFKGRTPSTLSMGAVDEVLDGGLATPVPLYTEGRVGGQALIGTSPEYYDFRGLRCDVGELPLVLGECVLGSRFAERQGLTPGERVLTDAEALYDLAADYPLRMHVVGVLAETGGPDDGVVFCSLETAWVAAGLGHGHDPAGEQAGDAVLRSGPDGVVLNAAVREFNEVTTENQSSFHFHGGQEDLPVTAVLIRPHSPKARTLLRGRYQGRGDVQALVPIAVMEELLGVVFRVKAFFDANALLVGGATSLFLAVIVSLSLAVRRRERITLFKLGCARSTVARLMATELGLVVVAGALLALLCAAGLVGLAARGLGPI